MTMQITKRLLGCLGCTTSSCNDKLAIEENGYCGYQCQDCALIYISPRPEPEEMVNLYDHDSAYVSAQELIDASCSYGKALKARSTLKLIRKYQLSGDLLEIGPGGGGFLQEAAKWGYRVHAAEFNPAQVKHIQALGIDCRQGAFTEVFEGMSFDVIYFCDVLSHFFDPVSEFRAMRGMLNPGGIVVFETGNFGDLDRRYYPLVDRWHYPEHLYFFSQRSLANLASASGFRIEMIREYSRSVEMLMGRLTKPAKALLKRKPQRQSSGGTDGVGSRPSRKRQFIRVAMNLKHVMDHALIYEVGSFVPTAGRPQTVIMVLRTAEE